MQLIGPSPSPAFKSSTLGIILPKAGTVSIELMDIAGQYVIPLQQVDLPTGRSNYELPIDKLQAAEYCIRVKYNDDTQIRKLIIR
jgi:hypothetical protein